MINLDLLLILPLVGFIFILFLPSHLSKQLALIFSFLALIVSLFLWVGLDASVNSFQYLTTYHLFNQSIIFGIDGIGINFIVLTTLILPICILASWDYIKFLEKPFYLALISILFILIGVFSILDILGFYVLYEAVLIPMFLIIGIWGARKEKITAAYYFFFYTLVGSIIMLLSIIYLFNLTGTTDYLTLLNTIINETDQKWIFLGLFASFAVKIPKFPFHIWLPLAHVEAPLAGSILLAGILIKLGSYGFIRFGLPLLPDACEFYAPLVNTLAVLAIIYASLTTIRQTDLKRIIAYSSVSHMGVVMLGIFSLTVIGIEGSIFLQIAHGLVSSALFIIVTIIYDRHHTRIVRYYRGITITMPIFSILFLFFTLANIGAPLTCNFIGEFMSLLGIFQTNAILGILGGLGMVLSACYALYLYNRVCFGTVSLFIENSGENRDITRREWWVLLPLAILTLILGVFPNIVLETIHANVLALIN